LSSVLIRPLKPSDFEDLAEGFFSFFPEAEADPSFGLSLYRQPPTIEDEHKWFAGVLHDLEAGNLVSVVAEVDSRVVGNCIVRRKSPGTPLDHVGSLGLWIRKEYRGRGIGTMLMKATIDGCRGKFEAIELTVLATNERAMRLYSKFGFRRIGTLPKALKRAGSYFDDDLMYLEL